MTIGERIKNRRKELKLTLKKIEEISGLTVSTLSEIENNKYTPSVSALIALTKALGVSTDWIIFGTDNVNVKNEKFDIPDIPLTETEIMDLYMKLSIKDKLDITDLIKIKLFRSSQKVNKVLKKEQNTVENNFLFK